MQRRIPVATAAAFVPRVFDEDIRRLHGISRSPVGQVGNLQMHCGDPRQTLIVRVQGGGYGRQSMRQPIGDKISSMGMAQQPFDLASLAHDEAAVAPLDQRRTAEQEAMVGAGEAEIVVVTCFTETPDPMNHFGPMIAELYALNPIVSR